MRGLPICDNVTRKRAEKSVRWMEDKRPRQDGQELKETVEAERPIFCTRYKIAILIDTAVVLG